MRRFPGAFAWQVCAGQASDGPHCHGIHRTENLLPRARHLHEHASSSMHEGRQRGAVQQAFFLWALLIISRIERKANTNKAFAKLFVEAISHVGSCAHTRNTAASRYILGRCNRRSFVRAARSI